MGYEFNFGWAFGGLLIMAIAAAILRFHQPIANAMGGGMVDYEKYKLYSLIAIIFGFLTTINIVPLVLYMIASTLFGGAGGGDAPAPIIEE